MHTGSSADPCRAEAGVAQDGSALDRLLDGIVYDLYAASLDLHALLGLLPGHEKLGHERTHTVIDRLDAVISTIRQAGVRPRSVEAAKALRELIGLMRASSSGPDLEAYLVELTRSCLRVFGVAAAAVVVRSPLNLVVTSPDLPAVRELCELCEGPGHEAHVTGLPVAVSDLAAAGDRWPMFSALAQAAGYLAVHAVALSSGGVMRGTLILFDDDVRTMPEQDTLIARGLAELASAAIAVEAVTREGEQVAARLSTALADNAAVEQAKGVLAERHAMTIPAAHAAMTEHADRHGLGLSEVARAVLAGGDVLGPG
ncbi:ANTAR domain-containing protein [Lentzea sp. NPDC004782]|uniref:ANTAR domain-containing protein n=1 Tax=Lentzea sp. NPDC004782 TaxID=3154458 RepID=UPI00339DD050